VVSAVLLFHVIACLAGLGMAVSHARKEEAPLWIAFLPIGSLLLVTVYAGFDFVLKRRQRFARWALLGFGLFYAADFVWTLFASGIPTLLNAILVIVCAAGWSVAGDVERERARTASVEPLA